MEARPLVPQFQSVSPQPAQPLASLALARRPAARAESVAAPRFSATQSAVAFGMEFALAQQAVARREEREARWRLELAETRAHPFQSAKVFPAYFPPA